MSPTEEIIDDHSPRFTVALANGRTLVCPDSLERCTWAAVLVDGDEIYRTTAAALAADPSAELTRLAEALIPGRPLDTGLPQPADQEASGWRECAVAAAKGGRTIRFNAAPVEADKLRICEANGREVVYWVTTEFEEDAQDCVGLAVRWLVEGER